MGIKVDMKNGVQVIDNFLQAWEFPQVEQYFMGSTMPWYFLNFLSYGTEEEKKDTDIYQLCNVMYINNTPNGIKNLGMFNVFEQKLDILAYLRIKANMTPKMGSAVDSAYHTDDKEFTEKNLKYITGIYYLNSNNGSTTIKDTAGDERVIESKANRLVLFRGDLQHKGTSSTDNRRVLINFNFILQNTNDFYEIQD